MPTVASPLQIAAESTVDAALALWQQRLPFAASLTIDINLANLPNGELAFSTLDKFGPDGRVLGGTITLDPYAAGKGWYVDADPLDHSEFGASLSTDILFAFPGSPAAGKYDLLTTILHEVGHLQGILSGYPGFDQHVAWAADGSQRFVGPTFATLLTDDGSHLDSDALPFDLMNTTLTPGVRKLPSLLDAQIITATRLDGGRPGEAITVSAALHGGDQPHDRLLNGNFNVGSASDSQFGWSVRGNVSVANGQAVLTEDSRVNTGMSQAFVIPDGTRALRFTITGLNLQATPLQMQDAFEVALLGADGTHPPLLGTATGLGNTDALLNIQTDGTVYYGPQVTVRGAQVSGQLGHLNYPLVVDVDLHSLAAGTRGILFFDLLGFGSLGSSVRIDNIQMLGPDGNHAPVANAESYQTRQGQTLQVNAASGVLANDTDAENDPLTAQLDIGPTHGTFALGTDGTILYAPNAGFSGMDSFTYRVKDADVFSAPVTVSILVNDAPTLSNFLISPRTVNEGVYVELTGVVNDPNFQNHTVTINWGDGTAPEVITLSAGVSTIPVTRHTYADDPAIGTTYQVTVVISDGFVSDTASLDVTVNNAAPLLATMQDVSINQGDTLRSAGSFIDVPADTWTATVDYGDGSGVQALILNANQTFAVDHTYAQAGVYTVNVTIRDDDGGIATTSQKVTVTAPGAIVQLGADVNLREGESLSRTGSFSDNSAGPWTATIDYGDGSGAQPLSLNADHTFQLSHDYASAGSFTVTVRINNGGPVVGVGTLRINVQSVAPTVSLGSTVTLNEGDTLSTTGSFIDNLPDTWTATVDFGTGEQSLTLLADRTFRIEHRFAHYGSYQVTVRVTDQAGHTGSATLPVQVKAVPPLVRINGPVTIFEGEEFVTSATFQDPGANVWTGTINYGDGSGTQSLPLPASGALFALRRHYSDIGNYSVKVQVQDDSGARGEDTVHVSVLNRPPFLDVATTAPATSGRAITIEGVTYDVGNKPVALFANYGDGTDWQSIPVRADSTFTLQHEYQQSGTFTITVRALDAFNGVTTATFTVLIGASGSADDTAAASGVATISLPLKDAGVSQVFQVQQASTNAASDEADPVDSLAIAISSLTVSTEAGQPGSGSGSEDESDTWFWPWEAPNPRATAVAHSNRVEGGSFLGIDEDLADSWLEDIQASTTEHVVAPQKEAVAVHDDSELAEPQAQASSKRAWWPVLASCLLSAATVLFWRRQEQED